MEKHRLSFTFKEMKILIEEYWKHINEKSLIDIKNTFK